MKKIHFKSPGHLLVFMVWAGMSLICLAAALFNPFHLVGCVGCIALSAVTYTNW